VLVLDFDGTICLGDGPVRAYADAILPHLDERLARQLTDGLLAYLEDHPGAGTYAGGYGAIAALAGPHVARADHVGGGAEPGRMGRAAPRYTGQAPFGDALRP
jgi:hypothetical protein